jgi:DNA-binding CsgD family transcriptional regulator
MRLESDPIAQLAGLTAECTSRAEYEAARLQWLERAVGFDASYFGAAEPEQRMTPVISGVSSAKVEECEAHAERYWRDRIMLHRAAAAHDGVVADHDALSWQARDRMPFYREVVAGHGIRATAVGLLRMGGRAVGSLFLGRVSTGAHFGAELALLRRALPTLSLGSVAHAALPQLVAARPLAPDLLALTQREQEVLELLCRGWTNAQIAARLGSSPRTVKNQVSAILGKTKTANRTQLVSRAALGRPA